MQQEKTPAQILFWHKFHVVMDIIIAVFIVLALAWGIIHVHQLEELSGDVCRMCMAQTHAICRMPLQTLSP